MVLAETVVVLLAVIMVNSVALPSIPLSEAPSSAKEEEFTKGPTKLLQAFGLSQPGVRRWHSEPPQYMLDLYNQVADPDGMTRLPGPYGSTVIRAFSERDESSGSSFSFSISGLEPDEQVLEAELHVYHSRLQKKHRHLLRDNIYMLEVSVEAGGKRHVLDKQHVAAHSSGWRVFQVGSWVTEVLAISGAKAGDDPQEEEKQVALEITARTPEDVTLSLAFHHGLQGARKPLLILFNSYTTSHSSSSPLSYIADLDTTAAKKPYDTTLAPRLKRSADEPSTTSSPPAIPAGCERRDMVVDFPTIGWSSWIVHPANYNAYQCIGQCSFPLGQDLNPTNHAIVQSIINNSGDYPTVQRPCCVPSMYGNLSLLYYDADETVVLKQYHKMVATECGCH